MAAGAYTSAYTLEYFKPSTSGNVTTYTYTPAVAESDPFTVSGAKTTDAIAVNTSKKTVTISGDYKLKLGSDVTTSAVKSNGALTTFASGTATYSTASGQSFTGTSKADMLNIAANNAAISGGGKVIFEGVNAGDKININSKTYTISGKTLK